jgi:hypothetical protein
MEALKIDLTCAAEEVRTGLGSRLFKYPIWSNILRKLSNSELSRARSSNNFGGVTVLEVLADTVLSLLFPDTILLGADCDAGLDGVVLLFGPKELVRSP